MESVKFFSSFCTGFPKICYQPVKGVETGQLGSGPTSADFGSEVSDGGSGWGSRNDGKVSKTGGEIADLANNHSEKYGPSCGGILDMIYGQGLKNSHNATANSSRELRELQRDQALKGWLAPKPF